MTFALSLKAIVLDSGVPTECCSKGNFPLAIETIPKNIANDGYLSWKNERIEFFRDLQGKFPQKSEQFKLTLEEEIEMAKMFQGENDIELSVLAQKSPDSLRRMDSLINWWFRSFCQDKGIDEAVALVEKAKFSCDALDVLRCRIRAARLAILFRTLVPSISPNALRILVGFSKRP